MIRYILKRVVAALITIWFIMTLTFVLMYAIPGSPISTEKVYDVALQQALEEKFGLNKPLHERYVKCLVDYAHGDFGISYLRIGSDRAVRHRSGDSRSAAAESICRPFSHGVVHTGIYHSELCVCNTVSVFV